MPELTFDQKVAMFRRTAEDINARNEFAQSRAEVVLPLLDEQSTVRAIFRPTRLAPGAEARWDIPFEDIDMVWQMPQIGGIPVVQVEGAELRVDTFGLDGGVEYQMDVARDGRIDVASLSTTLLKNKFIAQEELSGWSLIKTHAAALPAGQKVTGRDEDGTTSGTKKLNIHTINEVITVADGLGIGGRRVTDIYCSPRRFGDLREQITASALPENVRNSLWGNGQGNSDVAEIRFHRVYNSALVSDNKAYAFTQKDGFWYGIMPVREELRTFDNPFALLEWKHGIIGRERVGFGIMDDKGLMEIDFA